MLFRFTTSSFRAARPQPPALFQNANVNLLAKIPNVNLLAKSPSAAIFLFFYTVTNLGRAGRDLVGPVETEFQGRLRCRKDPRPE